MATFKVPIEGAVYVQAETLEAARQQVEQWFEQFPPVDEKMGLFSHRIAAREPQKVEPECLPEVLAREASG